MLTILFLGDIVGQPGRAAVISPIAGTEVEIRVGFRHRQR